MPLSNINAAGLPIRQLCHAEQKREATGYLISWIMAGIYSILALSAFSLDLFTISGVYLFEIPLLVCIVIGLLVQDPLARLVKVSVTEGAWRFYLGVVFVLVFCFVGVLTTGSFVAAYADFRANLVLLLGLRVAFVARRRAKQVDLLRFAVVCSIASVVYWCILALSGHLTFTKYATCYMAAVVGIVLASELKAAKHLLLSLACLLFVAGVSFFRQYWVVAFVGVVFVLHSVFLAFEGGVRRRAVGFLLAGCVITAAFGYVHLEAITGFFMNDESRYIQGIAKANDALGAIDGTGELSTSDDVRLGYFTFMVEHPLRLVVPHGLGSRSFVDNVDPYFSKFVGFSGVSTYDSALFYVAYHYGILTCLVLLAWFGISFRYRCKHKGIISTILLYCILLVPMLFEGAQATVIFRSFWLGAFVGLITYELRVRRLTLRILG